MSDERITLVVTMTVHKNAARAFREFETAAAKIMTAHGGAIERTVVTEGDADTFREVHIVTFPSADAFARYRDDPKLAHVCHLRQESVIATELLIGKDGPYYGPKAKE